MTPVTDNPWSWRRVLLGLAAFAILFGSAATASAQSPPNDQTMLRHIQPRGHRALQKINLAKAASEEVTVLDQRWTYEWNGTQWQHVSQTVYVYQQADRTEEWVFAWNGSAMINQDRTTYQLAAGHRLIELYEAYDPEASAFLEMDRYTYSYTYDLYTGEPLFLHQMTYETKIEDGWRLVERTTYDQPTETELVGVVDEWDGENWSPRDRFTMAETAQGVVQIEEERTGTGWTFTRRTTFPGFTIESLRETTDAFIEHFFDYAGLNVAAHLYPNYITEEWDGLSWVPSERKMSIVMDPDVANGLFFSGSVYETWADGQWLAEERVMTTHRTSDDKPVQSTIAVFTGTTWLTTLVETFEYDGSGDMIRATQQVDFGEGLENNLYFVFLWEHVTVGLEVEEVPGGYALDPAYPNPFNPTTSIQYRLASPGHVAVRAYDTLGRHVATLFEGTQTAGVHDVRFHADGLSSGVYMIHLEAGAFRQTRTVTLLK